MLRMQVPFESFGRKAFFVSQRHLIILVKSRLKDGLRPHTLPGDTIAFVYRAELPPVRLVFPAHLFDQTGNIFFRDSLSLCAALATVQKALPLLAVDVAPCRLR